MTIDKLQGIYCSLGDEEKKALYEWCSDNGYNLSTALTLLVRKLLIENEKTIAIDEEKVKSLVKSIMPLEQIEKSSVQTHRLCQKTEKLEEKIAFLQSSIDKLATRVEIRRIKELTDEDIAAVVKQPVEKVCLWRTGYQKPRGKRILEKLRPFEVIDGRWKLRNRIADSKNVTRFVTRFSDT